MSALYEQLYAYLVGQVDDTLQYLSQVLTQRTFDFAHVDHAAEMLRNALLTAEDRYVEAGERAE